MWAYIAVFFAALAVDTVPVLAPPAWTVMLPLVAKFELDVWLASALGAGGSTLGRYTLSLYMPYVSERVLDPRKNDNIAFLGKKLGGRGWASFLFVLAYSFTPLSTTALFTAAGMAKVSPLPVLPAFFIGKFVSDAVAITAGMKAFRSFSDLLEGQAEPKSLVFGALGLLIIAALLFVDWKRLLIDKRLRFDFRLFRTRSGRRTRRARAPARPRRARAWRRWAPSRWRTPARARR